METQVPASKSLHPLAWVAGIALILFSAVGVGAFMGWIPGSLGSPQDTVTLETRSAAISLPVDVPRAAVQPAAPVQPSAPVRHQATKQKMPEPVVQASGKCAECGVVESVNAVQSKGAGSGLGAVGGAVLGAIVGNQVGGGHGKDAMTVIGAVGGGLAGNEVEKRVKATVTYSTTVRFEDGTSRVFDAVAAPGWKVGDKVRIVDGAIRSNA